MAFSLQPSSHWLKFELPRLMRLLLRKELSLKSFALKGTYLVDGGIALNTLTRELGTGLDTVEADTLSGLITERLGRLLKEGDKIELESLSAEVLDAQDGCATRGR